MDRCVPERCLTCQGCPSHCPAGRVGRGAVCGTEAELCCCVSHQLGTKPGPETRVTLEGETSRTQPGPALRGQQSRTAVPSTWDLPFRPTGDLAQSVAGPFLGLHRACKPESG